MPDRQHASSLALDAASRWGTDWDVVVALIKIREDATRACDSVCPVPAGSADAPSASLRANKLPVAGATCLVLDGEGLLRLFCSSRFSSRFSFCLLSPIGFSST
jgi:hypothetical protein